jgi:hypothetical protein
VLLAATISGLVSGRLGSGELSLARTFGEAAVTPYNAEQQDAPASRSSILLAETSMQSLGSLVQEESLQPVLAKEPVDGDLYNVCERTRSALMSQAKLSAAGNNLPSGRVYKECMAALAPLRDHEKDSDAVDTLSDCMALVNALAAGNARGEVGSALCHDAVGVMQAAKRPVQPAVQAAPAQPQAMAAPAVAVQAAPQVKAPPQDPSSQAVDALELVTEAMTSVCTDTVRDAEVGIKSESDAMQIANGISHVCQEKARKHLGAVAASQALTKEWCQQLDGRLSVALETGFFFALAPEEAERQAREANPYASTTRKKFCLRFVNSLRRQAQAGGLYIKPRTKEVEAAPVKRVAASVPVQFPPLQQLAPAAPAAQVSAALPPLPTLPPAPRAQPVQVVVQPLPPAVREVPAVVAAPPLPPLPAVQSVTPQQSSAAIARAAIQHPAIGSLPAPAGDSGADMLHVVQVLSTREDWNAACIGLVSRLTSEEGAVTEEYVLGTGETPDGTKVLTFNPTDQEQVHKCAAQLKVLAIQVGIGGGGKKSALVSTGTSVTSSLQDAEDAEAIMDSPWAVDVCSDIAHGYLTARLAHPGLEVTDFCPLYARDVQAMRGAPKAQAAAQDMQMLRKRGGSLRHRLAQKAAAAPVKNEVKHPAAALISSIPAASNDEEQEGMDFWRDMLQS